MTKRRVIVNQMPLLYFHAAGLFEILEAMYGTIMVPRAVCRDLAKRGVRGYDVPRPADFSWMTITSAENLLVPENEPSLGPGEYEALGLAGETERPLLLLEGRHFRQVARRQGFDATGVLGLLLQARSEGHLPSVVDMIPRLRASGMLISNKAAAMVKELERGA